MSFTPGKLVCDFTGGTVGHRFRRGGGRDQSLPRAIGMNKGKTPDIVDATAGLGRDAFLLASLGANVTMIERSPVIHQLLRDGMDRACKEGGPISKTISRMTLILGDAKELLPSLSPSVILVDPMHPPRGNSALVKKEMRQIRDIVGIDEDSADLMKIALSVASNRVVLKWPRKATQMDEIGPPSHQIVAKSTRFDVFMTK